MSNILNKTRLLLLPMTLVALLLMQSSIALAFSDVNLGNGYYVEINYLAEQGIIDGYPDDTFRSNEEINRAEALKMLTIASGQFTEEDFEDIETEEDPFTDTPATAWYAKYLTVAKEKGIVDGYEDGSFAPGKSINLAEGLKIYLESYNNVIYPLLSDYVSINGYDIPDVPEDSWYTPYIAYSAQRDLLDIYPSGNVYPNQNLTRGYLASIIYKKKKSAEGYRFGKATYYGAAVQGNYTASGEIFDYHQLTAAHRTLPFGTMVEVTNLANGESIQVRITDRGPYGPGRVIDLTSEAFSRIASLGAGVIHVQYKVVETP